MNRRQLTKKEREQVYRKYLGHCSYCGCNLEYKDMQVDHFAPVYLFGDNTQMSNLMPACRQCNFRKGTLTVEKFRDELSKTIERLRRDNFMFRLAEKYNIIQCNENVEIKFFYERVREFLERSKEYRCFDEFSEEDYDVYQELCSMLKDCKEFFTWYHEQKVNNKNCIVE